MLMSIIYGIRKNRRIKVGFKGSFSFADFDRTMTSRQITLDELRNYVHSLSLYLLNIGGMTCIKRGLY